MADIENGIHDSLVATAEPDEEANRRRREQILGVVNLVLGPLTVVECVMCFNYGIKNSAMPIWALAYVLGLPAILVGYGFYRGRHSFRRIIREICNPEDELQVDAEGYLN
jgi:hypothetical protein